MDNEQTPLLAKASSAKVCPQWHQSRLAQALLLGIVPTLLLCVGVAILHVVEGWPLITCLYVMTQIVTTIGYGDITVVHPGTKLFMGFYVMVVLVVFAYYLNLFASNMVSWQDEGIRRHLRMLEGGDNATVTHKFGALNSLVAACALFLVVLTFGIVFFRLSEHCSCGFGDDYVSGCDSTTYELCSATGGKVIGWIDSFYMSSITLSTVGFGDYHPRSQMGQLVAIIWMLLGVGVTANFLAAAIAFFYQSQSKSEFDAMDFLQDLSRDKFNEIDMDGNGSLTKGEFVAYSLVKYMGVSADCVNDLYNEFDKIARNGGGNRVSFDCLQARKQELLAKGPHAC